MKRRNMLIATGLAGTVLGGRSANAQAAAYPSRPVRIVVPFTPGGTSDILARLISPYMTAELGQPVVVDNRPGAAANLGADYVARSEANGYSLFVLSTAHTINPSLYRNLNYDPVSSFAPISMIAATSQVVVVHPSLPVTTLRELIDYAKANPDKLNYSSVGAGSQPHLATELFSARAGIRMVHVPYRGAAEAMTAVLANQVHLTFATAPSAVPHIRSGALRGLAMTASSRMAALPDLPTVSEAGMPNFEVLGWNGLVAPAGTPAPVVARLNAVVVKAVANPALHAVLVNQGAVPWTTTPAEFAAYIQAEKSRWAEAVRGANVTLE